MSNLKVPRRLALLAALPLTLAFPALGQGAPIRGSAGISLLAGASTSRKTISVALLVDVTSVGGMCADRSRVPMTLGAWDLGVAYDPAALQYVGVTSCGVPQFSDPVCADLGAVVNCNDTNGSAGMGGAAPQGAVCVARLSFRNIGSARSSTVLSLLDTPLPRGLSSNFIAGCGGPSTFPSTAHAVVTIPTRIESSDEFTDD